MSHLRAAAVVAVLVAGLAGCGAEPDAVTSGACEQPTVSATSARLPAELDLPVFGTVTKVARRDGIVQATAVSSGTIEELEPTVGRALEDAGYEIVGSDNEIIEADLFFAAGQDSTGGVKFIEGPCQDQVTLRLFLSR